MKSRKSLHRELSAVLRNIRFAENMLRSAKEQLAGREPADQYMYSGWESETRKEIEKLYDSLVKMRWLGPCLGLDPTPPREFLFAPRTNRVYSQARSLAQLQKKYDQKKSALDKLKRTAQDPKRELELQQCEQELTQLVTALDNALRGFMELHIDQICEQTKARIICKANEIKMEISEFEKTFSVTYSINYPRLFLQYVNRLVGKRTKSQYLRAQMGSYKMIGIQSRLAGLRAEQQSTLKIASLVSTIIPEEDLEMATHLRNAMLEVSSLLSELLNELDILSVELVMNHHRFQARKLVHCYQRAVSKLDTEISILQKSANNEIASATQVASRILEGYNEFLKSCTTETDTPELSSEAIYNICKKIEELTEWQNEANVNRRRFRSSPNVRALFPNLNKADALFNEEALLFSEALRKLTPAISDFNYKLRQKLCESSNYKACDKQELFCETEKQLFMIIRILDCLLLHKTWLLEEFVHWKMYIESPSEEIQPNDQSSEMLSRLDQLIAKYDGLIRVYKGEQARLKKLMTKTKAQQAGA